MATSPARRAAAQLGPFDDPLAAWPNDDLLLEQAARDRLAASNPELLAVLDWPELRTLFVEHNAAARLHRERSRSVGLLAIVSAAAGVIIAGLAPLAAAWTILSVPAEAVAAAAAAALTTLGGLVGFWHWGRARGKSAWMAHRFWTERLRQLYFQHLLNDLQGASLALRDPAALAAWRAARATHLDAFEDDMRDTGFRIQDMRGDLVEGRHWLDQRWRTPRALPPGSTDVETILTYLRKRRLGIQAEYTSKKLQQNLASPRTRAAIIRIAGDSLSVLVVLLAFATAVSLLLGDDVGDLKIKAMLAAAATSSAVVAALRALDEGLRARVDAERYEWYLAAVADLAGRFDGGGLQAQVDALRDLERVAYQEMRRFVETHLTARFIP